ncbi:hypothetical protein [Corynebacterium sp.]|uniref:hypothetical protein n=1 Tax=Corynebacterium sp. TaxID=1720 RepID=UPI002A91EBCC|nr:hypothetical protein [Corynebacterium sp.]MDY5785287.1 hypothetical protein [Corynebacterium sp.]
MSTRRMSARRAATLGMAALCAGLTACANTNENPDSGALDGLAGPTWQVVAIYTDPDQPGALPPDAAGRAALTFGSSSMNGSTGCAPVRSAISASGDRLRLDEVEIDIPDTCVGGARHVHDTLTELLAPGSEFAVRRFGDTEAVLTRVGDEIDPPSIRVMSL